MKSLSCISLSKTREDPEPLNHIPIDSYKDNTKATVLGPKGPKIQTLIEVLRCELGKPRRQSSTTEDSGIGPSKQWTPLYYAVYHNREAALTHFLRAGLSPDDVTSSGQPPICIAAAAGHIGVVKILCEAGADTKAPTKHSGETALHIAIKNGRNDIMDVLLAYGPNLEARTLYTGETPLHYAAEKSGSLAAVVALLRCGASYEASNTKGCSPAEVALQTRNLHVAVAIISAAHGKRNKLAKEKEMLLKFVEKAQSRFSMSNELIADIFEAGCDPDSTVLVEAIKRDDVGLVDMFLEKGADPNRSTATGVHPIFAALNCSGAQVVQSLVKHGADVTARDQEGHTVLQAAFESPSAHDKEAISGIFEALLANGADANAKLRNGQSLLHHAVEPGFGLAKVAHRLIQSGVYVNELDRQGNTPLHLATHSKSCIDVLLKHGAEPNATNHQDLTPLLHAVKSATKETEPNLEALVKVSDPRQVDHSGKTALHLAAKNGLEKTVRLLLQSRAETTLVDSKKRTPLLLAVLNQQWSIVPLLAIQPGINSWDEDGKTALHYIAMSIPKKPATWKDVASAAAKFCERGVSRSMRDRSGATPLIQAMKTLPEEGLSVIEVLLGRPGTNGSNCIGHEDHKQRNALFYAATLGKPSFVRALLKNGAPFTFKEWIPGKGHIRPNTEVDKQTLKLIAEYEWLRRTTMLQRQSGVASETPLLTKVLPIRHLADMLSMGLDPNTPPRSKFSSPLLWVILNQTLIPPPLPPQYLHDILKLLLSFGANANATTSRGPDRSSQPRSSKQALPLLPLHPLTFLLEQYPTVDIDLITLFLDNGANLSTASPFYDGRYPLHSAVQANRMDVVDEFLTRRAEVDSLDKQGRTPLFIAAEKGFWEIVEELLRRSAKVNVKDSEKNTPLHAAAIGGSKRIVACLLRAGAKGLVKNEKGETPLACVPEKLVEKEKDKIVAMLKHAEDHEGRDAERKQKQLELEAVQEGRERLRKEREARQQQTSQITRASPPPQKLTSPTPPPAKSRASPAPAPQPTLAPPVHLSKQVVSVQYTPPSPKRDQPPKAPPKPAPNTQKPLPAPRIDSGFGYKKNTDDEKPLPPLDRNKTTFSGAGDGGKKTETKEDFGDWLAMSKLLDRL